MKKLLIATRNQGKFPEIVEKIKDLPFEFLSLNDFENAGDAKDRLLVNAASALQLSMKSSDSPSSEI